MDYWQIIVLIAFAVSILFVILSWCYSFKRKKAIANGRILESRRTERQSPVYAIYINEGRTRPQRPSRSSTRESSVDLPPTYAEAVREEQPP